VQRAGLAAVLEFIRSSPELKPIEDTKVENIFYSSSVFGQPDMQLIVAER
jgi:hypothetical protein